MKVDDQDDEGNTALHLAVQAGYWGADKYIEWLIKIGANPDNQGQTCFDLASGSRKELMNKLTGDSLKGDTAALMAAVNKGNVEAVAKLLEAGAAFDAIDSDNIRPRSWQQ